MTNIIEVKNIGKKYTINHQRGGYVTLRDVLTNIIKSPFRFLGKKAKEIVGINTKEDFWALRNINFSIEPGEVIGVIGPNGAGKSTLLKILTGITPPTEGEIKMRGKIASLLEVGTGFHPELTGRENVFLNGAILGMTRKEITRKFDEIVSFAGIEKFLDTPVKYYSSGMYVRLAFSVAAHMEPDILLVDEVLAVGDAEFQKKCLGKMEEVTRKSGRTILFVSHNMSAIKSLCKKTIYLDRGEIKQVGETAEVISNYLQLEGEKSEKVLPILKSAKIQVKKVKIMDEHGILSNKIEFGKSFRIEIDLLMNSVIQNTQMSILCTDLNNNKIFFTSDSTSTDNISKISSIGEYKVTFTFPSNSSMALNEGAYYLYIQPEVNGIDGFGERVRMQLSITKPEETVIPWDWSKERRNGPVSVVGKWVTEKLK